MFDEMKVAMAAVGKLADQRPSEPLNGYLAERPEGGLRNCVRIWAPCGCCWTYMTQSLSVLTQCDTEVCPGYSWSEGERALAALLGAEKEGEKVESPKLAIVAVPKT